MAAACAGGQQNPDAPGALSDLLNPNSNCLLWRLQYESAFTEGKAGMETLILQLDQAKVNWCRSELGLNSKECDCMAFPTRQAQQCTAQANVQRGCQPAPNPLPPGVSTPPCPGRLFVRNNDGCNGCCRNTNNEIIPCQGQYIQVELTQCVPFYCWVAECLDSENQLLTSDVLAGTLLGGDCYQGLCMSVVGTDVISVNNASLMPPNAQSNSFTPGYQILANCGAPNNPLPLITPTLYKRPVDQLESLPVVVSNSGQYNVLLRLVSQQTQPSGPSVGVFAVAPTQIVVPAKGIMQFFITFIPGKLQNFYAAAAQGTPDGVVNLSTAATQPGNGLLPGLVWTYEFDWEGTTQQFPVTIGDVDSPQLELQLVGPSNAPAASVPVPSHLPLGVWVILGVCAIVFILAIVKTLAEDRKALQVRDQAREVLQRLADGGPLGDSIGALDFGKPLLTGANPLAIPKLF